MTVDWSTGGTTDPPVGNTFVVVDALDSVDTAFAIVDDAMDSVGCTETVASLIDGCNVKAVLQDDVGVWQAFCARCSSEKKKRQKVTLVIILVAIDNVYLQLLRTTHNV